MGPDQNLLEIGVHKFTDLVVRNLSHNGNGVYVQSARHGNEFRFLPRKPIPTVMMAALPYETVISPGDYIHICLDKHQNIDVLRVDRCAEETARQTSYTIRDLFVLSNGRPFAADTYMVVRTVENKEDNTLSVLWNYALLGT